MSGFLFSVSVYILGSNLFLIVMCPPKDNVSWRKTLKLKLAEKLGNILRTDLTPTEQGSNIFFELCMSQIKALIYKKQSRELIDNLIIG